MAFYEDAPVPIRAEFEIVHQRFWARLQRAGTWLTARERVAVAHEARHALQCELCAQRKAALSPYTVDGVHDRSAAGALLSDAMLDAVHRIVTDASRLTRQWHEQLCAKGVSVEAYVEMVGTVVSLISIDQFCRAIGMPVHPLPEPLPGEPSRYRPASASQESAWVPMVPGENANTPEADLWASGRTGNVIRAMSLVPDEVRTLADLSAVHYLPNPKVRDMSAEQGSLNRAQMELIAGRVSSLNGCFY